METSQGWELRRGRVWKFGDDINTDLMYPGFLNSLPEEERHLHCMSANRPGWAVQVQEGDILIAGKDFGTGSARPAAQSLFRLGIRCILAEAINGLFLRNAINFGLPVMPTPGIAGAFEEGDIAEVELMKGQVRNTRTDQVIQATALPERLLNVVAEGGLIPLLRNQGYVR